MSGLAKYSSWAQSTRSMCLVQSIFREFSLGQSCDTALRNESYSNSYRDIERGIQDCQWRSLATAQTFQRFERCRI